MKKLLKRIIGGLTAAALALTVVAVSPIMTAQPVSAASTNDLDIFSAITVNGKALPKTSTDDPGNPLNPANGNMDPLYDQWWNLDKVYGYIQGCPANYFEMGVAALSQIKIAGQDLTTSTINFQGGSGATVTYTVVDYDTRAGFKFAVIEATNMGDMVTKKICIYETSSIEVTVPGVYLEFTAASGYGGRYLAQKATTSGKTIGRVMIRDDAAFMLHLGANTTASPTLTDIDMIFYNPGGSEYGLRLYNGVRKTAATVGSGSSSSSGSGSSNNSNNGNNSNSGNNSNNNGNYYYNSNYDTASNRTYAITDGYDTFYYPNYDYAQRAIKSMSGFYFANTNGSSSGYSQSKQYFCFINGKYYL